VKTYRSERARKGILSTYDQLLALWGTPFTEFDVPTSYGSTHIVACGQQENPPLVLFHGVGDDAALMWLYNAAALSRRFRLYAVDTIGGPGKSVAGSAYNRNYDDVAWMDELFAALRLKTASLMGVSNGGYLVQLFTLHRPEKVDKALSLAASVPVGNSGSPIKTMMKIFLPEALLPTRRNVRRLIQKLSGANARAFTDNDTVMEHFTWLLKGFNNMAMRYHRVRLFTEDEVSAVRGKVFYLVGLDDRFQKLGGAAALKAHGMNARSYPGVGHGINHEIAGEINQTVIGILEGRITDLRTSKTPDEPVPPAKFSA
jgi:pimeloyl-ACP methyl ester carboxylesterase